MIFGVTRTEGMRRLRARRLMVDSLTCNTFASCRAVKNSSRSSMIELGLSYRRKTKRTKHKTLPNSNCRLPIDLAVGRGSLIGNWQSPIGNHFGVGTNEIA